MSHPTSLRIAQLAAVSAALSFAVGGFMLSPLSTGVTSGENQDHLALWGTLGWAASHAVGAVAAIVAWVSTHRTGVSTWTVGLCVLHGILLLVAGTIAGVVLLISGSHFH